MTCPPSRCDLPDLTRVTRPRLRPDVPIMWRDRTSIQVGDDVILDRVDRDDVAWMASLDGLRSTPEIEVSVPIPHPQARRLVRGLLAAGALDDAARIPDASRWASRPDRDTLHQRFGAALLAYRDLDSALAVIDARAQTRVSVVGVPAEDLTAALESAGLSCVPPGEARLTVLADGHHPDVPASFDHAAQDLPHLHVGVFGPRATVGPLVVPGVTSCLRCAHLHRRDADPAWPVLSVQWAQAVSAMSRPPIDPLLSRLAADHAAVLACAWADAPDEPARWADRAVEIRLPEGRVTRVRRPPHPLCGCRWPDPDPAEWTRPSGIVDSG